MIDLRRPQTKKGQKLTDEPGSPSGPSQAETTSLAASGRLDRRFEVWEAAILAVATLLTAWSAFQATKWSGVQADNYSVAAGTRAEAVRAEADGDSQVNIDVEVFLAWLAAFHAEAMADPDASRDASGVYQPDPTTLSGFLHDRFRDELLPAFDAWIAEKPILNPESSATPFDRPEYRVAKLEEAAALDAQADQYVALAREANQRGDNYVLVAVLFASVMLFAGIGSKMDTLRARVVLFTSAVVVLGASLVLVVFMPKTF